MSPLHSLEENFKFLTIEVSRQIEDTHRILGDPDESLITAVAERDDYIDNLRNLIETTCYKELAGAGDSDKQTIDLIRAVHTSTANLERIADVCQSVVEQTRYLRDRMFLHRFDSAAFFVEIRLAMRMIDKALFSRDVTMALRICRSEFTIDRYYAVTIGRIIEALEGGKNTGDLVTSLFIFNYLERLGDGLLNIGEAILMTAVGEKIKVDEFEHMEASIEGRDAGSENTAVGAGSEAAGGLRIRSFLETRSGCRIDRVTDTRSSTPRWTVFKEGKLAKIAEERANLERWEKLAPGLPPHVFDYQEHGENASLLVEFINGRSLQEILLTREEDLWGHALGRLIRTVDDIWTRTLTVGERRGDMLRQVRSRLPDVRRVHPDFDAPCQRIGSVRTRSLDDLLTEAEAIEARLPVPFSVFGHGDFNIDNVLYEESADEIHFIDVHRSRDLDYVQDVSVFLVSNFRLPIFDPGMRGRMTRCALTFLEFARGFARRHDDRTFEWRLCLGLIRSFITSTRFELKEDFAREMYLRGIYLLERITTARPDDPDFRVPRDVLNY